MKVYKCYFYAIFILSAAFGTACSTAPTVTTNNLNSNTAVVVNSNAANSIATNTAVTPQATPSPLAAAGNPSATIAAYYQARVKKDEKGFRQSLSKATLSEFSANAQTDGEKTLVGWYNSIGSPPKQPYETRNERISGDTALVEAKDSGTTLWFLFKLVREDGEWKMDLTSATTNSLLKQQPK